MTLQHSPLGNHARASRLLERLGWELPAVYTDPATEYQAATTGAAMHDASYVGRLKGTGPDLLDLLNRMSTNLVLNLQPSQGAPTILTTDRGRILDLLGVTHLGEYVLLLTSPGAQPVVIEWLDKYTIMEELTIEDITTSVAMLSVVGPRSQAAVEQWAGVSLGELAPFHCAAASFQGHSVQIIRRPLGELPAYDLLVAPESAAAVWQSLADDGVIPLGMEAFEASRINYGVPAYGLEMGEPYNPLEAGLIGSIDFHKGCYIGQEVIARLDTYQKVQRQLVTLRFSPDATVAADSPLHQEGRQVGKVTSVSQLPTTGEIIGLGYVRKGIDQVGMLLTLGDPSSGNAEIASIPMLFGPGAG